MYLVRVSWKYIDDTIATTATAATLHYDAGFPAVSSSSLFLFLALTVLLFTLAGGGGLSTRQAGLKALYPKGLTLLCFKPLQSLRPDFNVRSPYFVYPDEESTTGQVHAFDSGPLHPPTSSDHNF